MSELRTPPDPALAAVTALAPDAYLQGEATTLIDVLHQFEASGFGTQFDERDGRVRCLTCRQSIPSEQIAVRTLRRLEGASDPADALAVAAVVCPHCGASGALTLNYGPEATPGEAEVLLALPQATDEIRPRSDASAMASETLHEPIGQLSTERIIDAGRSDRSWKNSKRSMQQGRSW